MFRSHHVVHVRVCRILPLKVSLFHCSGWGRLPTRYRATAPSPRRIYRKAWPRSGSTSAPPVPPRWCATSTAPETVRTLLTSSQFVIFCTWVSHIYARGIHSGYGGGGDGVPDVSLLCLACPNRMTMVGFRPPPLPRVRTATLGNTCRSPRGTSQNSPALNSSRH